ncbi:MAG: hypothetical protein U9R08_02250 [Nanoarchaeota archaeon]|nr:hypothetical protein [Nanoarchaeota archaeon]
MVDNTDLKELEKLTPEERIKVLRVRQAAIEKEMQDELKVAEDLIEKSNIEIEQESEETKLEKLFKHIQEDNLEDAVKEETNNIEERAQYNVVTNEVDQKIEEMKATYTRNDDVKYKKDEVAGSYKSEMTDTATETWKELGYEKPIMR